MKPSSLAIDADPRTTSLLSKPRLSKEEMHRLCQRSNVRSAYTVGWTVGGIVALFVLVNTWPNIWTFGFAFLVMGGFQHALTIIQHEASHYLLFTNRRFNEIVLALVAWSVGFTRSYRAIHLKHYQQLGYADDPDAHNYEHYPSGIGHFASDFVTTFFGVAALFQFLKQTFQSIGNAEVSAASEADSIDPKSKNRAEEGFDKEVVGVAMMQLAILTVLWSQGVWYQYFVLWLIPLVTITKTLVHIRNIVEHTLIVDIGDPEFSRYRTIGCNFVEQFFFAPMWFNYHAEHHLFPGIPYHRLPAAHRVLSQQEEYQRIVDVEQGYVRFLVNRVIKRPPAVV